MSTPRATSRTLAVVATTALLGWGASACGGGGDEPEADPSGSPTSSASTASPSDAGTASGASTDAAEPYLPVPEGVALTAPGTDLELGDEATVAWEPRQDEVGAVTATVEAIEKTSFEESFVGWQLSKDVKRSTPYFVRAEVVNDGAEPLDELAVPLFAVDDSGGLVEATTFKGTFEPCPDEAFPKRFDEGDDADLCLVYLAAPGRDITGVGFRPTEDFDQITWTGDVTKVGEQPADEKDAEDDQEDTKDEKDQEKGRDDQEG